MIVEKESTSIKPKEISIIDSDKIIESNKLKWKIEGKKYTNIYEETQDYIKYSNVLDRPTDELFKILLEIYLKSKSVDAKSKYTVDAILSSVKSLEVNTETVDKQEFLCKMDAFVDYFRKYENN